MGTKKTSNVPLSDFRKFLRSQGAKQIRTNGGHEIWSHKNLSRPIPLQTHIDPVPEFIVLEVINYFEVSSVKMWEIIKPPKGTTERKGTVSKRGKRSKGKK